MILTKDGRQLGDANDVRQPMSLQEPLAVMRTSPLMTRISETMEQLGWDPYEVRLAHYCVISAETDCQSKCHKSSVAGNR